MSALAKSILLFFLNFLDAQLTVLWVRAGLATEGNGLMARLLEMGYLPFISVKLLVGGFAAYTLYRFANRRLARRGLSFALGIYLALMFVHAATGMSALGWRGPEQLVTFLGSLPNALLAFLS